MPIKDIEELDKTVNAFGEIELNRLIRKGSVNENLDFEKKMWDIKVEKKVLNLLKQSSPVVANHFEENIENYKNEWINKVKENFDIPESKDNSNSPNWRKTIEKEKDQNTKERLK